MSTAGAFAPLVVIVITVAIAAVVVAIGILGMHKGDDQ